MDKLFFPKDWIFPPLVESPTPLGLSETLFQQLDELYTRPVVHHIPCCQENIGGLSKDPFSPSSAPLKPNKPNTGKEIILLSPYHKYGRKCFWPRFEANASFVGGIDLQDLQICTFIYSRIWDLGIPNISPQSLLFAFILTFILVGLEINVEWKPNDRLIKKF